MFVETLSVRKRSSPARYRCGPSPLPLCVQYPSTYLYLKARSFGRGVKSNSICPRLLLPFLFLSPTLQSVNPSSARRDSTLEHPAHRQCRHGLSEPLLVCVCVCWATISTQFGSNDWQYHLSTSGFARPREMQIPSWKLHILSYCTPRSWLPNTLPVKCQRASWCSISEV